MGVVALGKLESTSHQKGEPTRDAKWPYRAPILLARDLTTRFAHARLRGGGSSQVGTPRNVSPPLLRGILAWGLPHQRRWNMQRFGQYLKDHPKLTAAVAGAVIAGAGIYAGAPGSESAKLLLRAIGSLLGL